MSDGKKISPTIPDGCDRTETPEFNPAGAARRRLLRAVVQSGGVAIGGLLAAHWRKPIIKAVILPAHAATSGAATGCVVTLSAQATSATGSASYTLGIYAIGTGAGAVMHTVGTASGSGTNTTMASGTISLPPDTYQLIFSNALIPSGSGAVSSNGDATCCTNTWSTQGTLTWYGGLSEQVVVKDDGTCSFA